MKTGNDMNKMKKIVALTVIALCLAPVAAQAGHRDLGGPIIALPDAQPEAYTPIGLVGDEPASGQDGADTSGADLGIGLTELCGAGSGGSLMFGLMGLVGMHGSSRSRRKARNQRKARLRQNRATNN
ncbi:MAG: hypothetical protein IID41_12345 [Planctomycetes bacterium]|nr:hypothetical protein [Planctomycetota bacterium]